MPTKPMTSGLKAGTSTYDIINAIRMDTSTGINFKDRIPTCSQETLANIGTIFDTDSDLANAFLNALVNRIGLVIINQKRYTNNLKAVKQGKLDYGETIEEIAYGLVKGACDYDVETGVDDVFKISKPEVASALHKVNFQQKYKTSFTHFELRKAFTSASSLGDFLEGIITSVYNSYEVDEQLAYKNLVVQMANKNFFFAVPIALPDDEATGKIFVKKVKQYANAMQFMNTKYNSYGLPQFTKKEDLVIILRADIDAAIEVDVLAAAFQAYAVDFVGSGRKIMVDDFGDPNIYAVVCDRRAFQIYDYDLAMDKIYNPSNRVWNYFLHVWEVISASPFMQGIVITAQGTGSVTAITLGAATTTPKADTTDQITATVTGTGIFNKDVTWSMTGGTASSIDQNGLVTIGAEAAETALVIKAVSNFTSSVEATITITVTAA